MTGSGATAQAMPAAVDLTNLNIVVLDNNGGAIFDFLPQATKLDAPTFERLFTTPHNLSLDALPGTNVEVIAIDAPAVDTHRAVHAAVAAALGG